MAPGGAASIKPHPSAFRMANLAERIVEARVLDDGRVEAITDHFVAAGVTAPRVFSVPSLAAMPRVPFDWNERATEPIRVDTVLLFLIAGDDGTWEPLHLLDGRARGVVWFAGHEAWGYAQWINPGHYELTRWNLLDGPDALPASPAAVRREVATGLAARARWQRALAIADGQRRAEVLATWFSPATSPDGAHWRERWWPDLHDAARALGAPLVLPLAEVIANDADGEAVGFAARGLEDLQTGARGAVPAAIARLRDLRGARAVDLLRLLRAAQDRRAIEVLREYTAKAGAFDAAEAGLALHRCGDREAAARLRARVPLAADGSLSIAEIAALLDALHEVDAAGAEALLGARFQDVRELMAQRGWMRRSSR